MPFRWPHRWTDLWTTLPVAVGFLCLHAITLLLSGKSATFGSYFFLFAAPLLAAMACIRRGTVIAPCLRAKWVMFAAGLLLFSIGMAVSAWADLITHASRQVAFISDFFFFFFGVPILISVTLTRDDLSYHFSPWIDAVQAVLAGVLVYTRIFSALPFTHEALRPASVTTLIWTYGIEDFLLALVATLRLVSFPKGSADRRFTGIIAVWLWGYGLITTAYNLLDVHAAGAMGLRDLIPVLPFLALAVYVLAMPADAPAAALAPLLRRRTLIFIENGITVFFSLVLLALGASAMRENRYVGFVAIVLALMLYGLRATLLQSGYAEAQLALRQAHDRLEELSLLDPLTGVANRRRFDQALGEAWARTARAHEPLALLMIDVDHFKRLNDQRGHPAGDVCLRRIAAAVDESLNRAGDLVARYGGEEFAVILPDTTDEGARFVAARIRLAIRELRIPYMDGQSPCVTVSIGIAVCASSTNLPSELLVDAADRALYRAKQNGRDRIESSPDIFLKLIHA